MTQPPPASCDRYTVAAASVIIAARCNYCSRQQTPAQLHRIGGEGGKVICQRCMEWHDKAISAAGGQMPHACQECGITSEQLEAVYNRVRYFLVPKDGVYQILCSHCEREYVAKRQDLYGVIDDARLC